MFDLRRLSSNMPGKYRRKRAAGAKRRRKWRQQKLAVGTVERIARDIAKREDKKMLVKYVHTSLVKASTATWTDYRALPQLAVWRSWYAGQQDPNLLYKCVSEIGGNVRAVRMQNQSANDRERLSIRIHGVETFGVVRNEAPRPARFEVRLIFIPNLNQFTNDAIDYLRPRITMFHKTGPGTPLYAGYNRKSIAAQTATGHPIKFQTLARKVIHLPAASIVGAITPATGTGEVVSMQTPQLFKRFKLAKYFKKPRIGYCNDQDDELSNGNYYLVYWNDLPANGTANVMKFIAATNMQYSLKGPLLPDVAPG